MSAAAYLSILLSICALFFLLLKLGVQYGWLRRSVALAIRLVPWLSADYRLRRIPRRQKCVACGAGGKKSLRYDPVQKLVIVQCPICQAAWGYEPVVKAAKFSAPMEE